MFKLNTNHIPHRAQVRSPRDVAKVVDVDWGASDRPVLALADGTLRVSDIHLKATSSPVAQYCMPGNGWDGTLVLRIGGRKMIFDYDLVF